MRFETLLVTEYISMLQKQRRVQIKGATIGRFPPLKNIYIQVGNAVEICLLRPRFPPVSVTRQVFPSSVVTFARRDRNNRSGRQVPLLLFGSFCSAAATRILITLPGTCICFFVTCFTDHSNHLYLEINYHKVSQNRNPLAFQVTQGVHRHLYKCQSPGEYSYCCPIFPGRLKGL